MNEILIAQFEAKVKEIISLVSRFEMDLGTILFNLDKLNDLFLSNEPKEAFVNNHLFGLKNSMADILFNKPPLNDPMQIAKIHLVYQKIGEAKILGNILFHSLFR